MENIFPTINFPLAFTAILINFILVILVLVRTSRTIIYMIFLFICLSIMLWNVGTVMAHYTERPYWFYFSLINSSFIPTLMYHFVITLIKPEQKSTPGVILTYFFSGMLALSSGLAIVRQEFQWFIEKGYWDIFYFIMFAPFFLSIIIKLSHAIIRSTNADEKSRIWYILLAALIGVVTLVTDHVQTLNIPVPPLGHFGSVFSSSILAIGVFKHRTAYDILAQMRMKLEVLSEMAAGITHEIRNPLSSIKGAANLLSYELKNLNDPKSHEYALLIIEEIERLNNILVNFQYFTKPLKIEKEPVSINEVIQKTVRLAESDTLNIKIRMELSQDIPMVQADTLPMKQVFLNLIKNASDACGSNGELVIKTEHSAPWVKITFADNGQGIPQELLDHIFEPFFTTKTTGMGVGLAISQKIIQAHNGKIEVNNILPKGTQFTIFLPV